jgi:hypothetical protein
MKKLIFLSLAVIGFTFASVAQSTTPRFGTTPNKDNTGRVLTYSYSAPAYASTITVAPKHFETIYKVDSLTGNPSVVTTLTNAYAGDRITFIFAAKGAARTVTFSTGMTPSATLVVDSAQVATATFMFSGSKFVEVSRAKQ